jgi:hypothetical protein
MLRKVNMNEKEKLNSVPKSYIIKKLLSIAEFSLEEEEIYDKDGNFTGKKKMRDAGAALRALESLYKYMGFGADEDKGSKVKIVTIANLDDKKI